MGDRFDAKYLKNTDSMHFIMPFMFPNRCDNETFFTFRIDLTQVNEYVRQKNAADPEYKYNLFQCLIAAALKTITLRSKLSIFIHDRKMYKRNEISAAFTVKQEFSDEGGEVLAFIHSKPDWTIDDLHNELHRQLLKLKNKSYADPSSGFMNKFNSRGLCSISLTRLGRSQNVEIVDEETTTYSIFCEDNYALEMEQFARCILLGEAPCISQAESLRCAKVMDMVIANAR